MVGPNRVDGAEYMRRARRGGEAAKNAVLSPAAQRAKGGHHVQKMVARQERMFDLVVHKGLTIKEACEKIGMHRATYEAWRSRSPEWRTKFDHARAAQRGIRLEGPPPLAGGFAEFRKKYFGFDTYKWQREMVRVLEEAPPMSVSLILCHPHSGKSSIIEDWCNYKLGVDPNHRIMVLSESQRHSRKLISRVQNRMTQGNMSEGIARYIEFYGPFHENTQSDRAKSWTADHFTVYRSDHDERDFSMEALGWKGQIYGARADTVILDDVQTLKSLNATQEILDKFRQEVVTRPGREGRIVIVGTRVAVGDIYEALIDAGVVTPGCFLEFPAVDLATEGHWDQDKGQWDHVDTLCPEMWPAPDMGRMRKAVGEQVWWRSYMMRPQVAGDATFTDEMIEQADDPMLVCAPPEGTQVVLSLDPALGGGNSLLACAVNHERMFIFDCQLDYGLARTEDIQQRIEEMAGRYHPLYLIIEKAAFQRGLCRDERLLDMARRYGFRIIEHETSGVKSDPILGVGAMAGSFIRQEISIAAGDAIARTRLDPLRAELRAWRPNIATRFLRQDTVMSAWFAWKWWMSNRASNAVAPGAFKSKGLPWAPTGWRAALRRAA